jgi:hypothetical protein
MSVPSDNATHYWSTAVVDPPHGFDYYGAAVGSALVPVCVDCRFRSHFHASVATASLGNLKVLTMSGHAHAVTRGQHELAHSERHIT